MKPILANLLRSSDKLSRGTIYSLMANCLQFRKEAAENAGNSGVSMTRALLSELLAIKLLKEYSYRELVGLYKFKMHVNPITYYGRSMRYVTISTLSKE